MNKGRLILLAVVSGVDHATTSLLDNLATTWFSDMASNSGVRPRGSHFVGRRHELRLLGDFLMKVRAGAAGSVAIVGEPGIGKTRLVGELAARAESSGFQVLSGRGSEFEHDVPFGLIIDALDRRFGELGPAMLARLGEERVTELASLFPSVAGDGRRLSSSLEIERFRSHFAVRAALEQLAGTGPVLLVLDDLQWADPASLELVAHLLRHEVRAIMVVTVYRRNSPVLQTGFDRAAQEAGMRTVELGPLPVTDLAESVGDRPDSARVRAVYEESGGNPFYFAELIKSFPVQATLLSTNSEPGAVPARAGVPHVVRTAIRRELDTLPLAACRLAQAAAVMGEPFDVDLAGAVADLTEPVMLAALDELVAADLVHPTHVPGRLVFRHPIVRRAVYEATGPGWRLGAHRRAAAELTRRGGSLSARAHHVERSANVGDEDAVALLTKAGQCAASRAPAAAARWLAGAERLLPPAAASRRIELLLSLAAAHTAAGRSQESREVLETARILVDPADRAMRGRITALLAGAEQALGRSEQAQALLTEALGHMDEGSAEAVALTVELAMTHLAVGEWRKAVGVATDAAERAHRLGDRSLVASATVASGFAMLNVHESGIRSARHHTRQAAEFFAGLPDDELTQSHLTTLATLALVESVFRRWASAQQLAERGLRLARESGRGDVFLPLTLALLSAATMKGELSKGAPLADDAVEAAVLTGNDQWIAPIEGMRCRMLSQQGRIAEALASGRRAVRAAARAPRSMFWWVAPAFHGTALIEAGRHDAGRRELHQVGGSALSAIPPTSRPYWRNVLVHSYLATGEVGAARRIVDLMERTETEQGRLLHPAEARMARAGLLFATGHTASAAQPALEAAELYEDGEMYIDAARARMFAGRALLANGSSTTDGERELTRAHEVLVERGATRLAAEAARELRSVGHRVRPRTRSRDVACGVESLSDRELEIADRVARGRTNRQIAEELYISPKTVEAHLARTYTKLGVRSRTAMVVALGLALEHL